jgi:hypothetical protein
VSDRDELMALRRMAELEAKASGGAPAQPQARQMGIAEGLYRMVQRGATLGWSDEIAGGMDAVLKKLQGDPRAFGELYDSLRSQTAAQDDRFKAENPTAGALAEGTGTALTMVPSMVATGGAAVPASLPTVMARSGAAGAGAGYAAGAGSAQPGERMQGGNEGAAVGAAAGLALPPAIAAAQLAARPVAGLARAAGRGASNLYDLVSAQGPQRIAGRTVQDLVADENRGPLIEALLAQRNFPEGYKPTAAQQVQGTDQGTLVQSLESTVARRAGNRDAGNPSVMFAQRDSGNARALEGAKKARDELTSEMRDNALSLANMTTEGVDNMARKIEARFMSPRDIAVAEDFGGGARQRQGELAAEANKLRTEGIGGGRPVTPTNADDAIAKILSKPGERASTVVQQSMSSISARLKKITAPDGTINAHDMYMLRKEVGNEIEKSLTENASFDKKLAGGLRTKLKDAIDATIEDALPNEAKGAWRSYLKTYSARSEQIDNAVTAAENAYKPGRPTDVSGAEAGEINLPLPATLSRPGLLARSVLGMAGREVTPKVDAELAKLLLDPEQLAVLLGKTPPKRVVVDALTGARNSTPLAAGTASIMAR